MEVFFYLFLAGLVGGFMSGLVGIGGGIVFIFAIPDALKYLGVPLAEVPQFTIANSIFGIFFSSVVANIMNIRSGHFYFREVFVIGLLGSVASLAMLKFIVETEWYNIYVFNMITILLLFYMLYSTVSTAKKVYITELNTIGRLKLTGVGLAGGLISSLSGMGGGIVVIPILNSFFKVDIKKASSISLGVICIMSLFMTFFNLFAKPLYPYTNHFASGYIIFPIALCLAAGVLITSPIGVKLSRKLPHTYISYIYALFLIIVLVKKVIELIKAS